MTARPRALTVVVVLTLAQSLALVGLGMAFVIDIARGHAQDVVATTFIAAFLVLVGIGLAAAARALLRSRRWARGPVMTGQIVLLALSVGWWRQQPSVWVAAVLLSAVLVGVGLMLPRVVAATTGRSPQG